VIAGTAYAFHRYGAGMDFYETWILAGTAPSLIALGWFWRPLRALGLGVGAAVLIAIALYARTSDDFGADLAAADTVFLLKYFLSSQSAILWMSLLFFMSTAIYWIGLLGRRDPAGDNTAQKLGTLFAWAAVVMALIGSLVRWYESHQIAPDIGHIPVSNLYEVFVMFCWMTTLFYLYYEQHYKTRALGAFVMLIVSAAVGFLLWYTLVREAHEIQPLVPALQSWWMKLHVPANFVGYGTFAIAAMVAFAYLIKQQAAEQRWWKLAPLWLLGVVLCFEPLVFRRDVDPLSTYWALYFGISALLVAGILSLRGRIAERLPSFEVLDDVMYKAIAVGFAFFTIATILGALLGRRGLGRLLELGPEGNLGADRLAQLRGLAAHAPDEGPARRGERLVGAGGPGGHDLRLPRREHVPVGPAQLRRAVTSAGGCTDLPRGNPSRTAPCTSIPDRGFPPRAVGDHAARAATNRRRVAGHGRRGRRRLGHLRCRPATRRPAPRPAGAPARRRQQRAGAGTMEAHRYADASTYNNFYEFGTDKADPARNAGTLKTRPWTVADRRRMAKPGRYDIEALLKLAPMESASTGCAASRAGRWSSPGWAGRCPS
jgi:ABC-type transport system involved in cytochrome c biogenesis permease subunit